MRYLLSLSIGPVQDFIAAGRRTADLYAGSRILEALSRKAAEVLQRGGASLIFPADPQVTGVNKVLAELGDKPPPERLVQEVRLRLEEYLLQEWEAAVGRLPRSYRDKIQEDRAKAQLRNFLEFYAAWVPFQEDYAAARRAVERMLAGRKALRDFAPLDQGDQGVPKSPLDPAWAAVINAREWGDAHLITEDGKRPLRIKPTEHLDAISLFKRLFGVLKHGQVESTRVLARRSLHPQATAADVPGEEEDGVPEPWPYFAILVADGDRMGELIGRQASLEAHRKLSEKIGKFAKVADTIVREHHGLLVYSGGDDVLAFLPANQAVVCAKRLAQAFREKVGGTLSVGVAIVHYREPLSLSLEAARGAERAAKNKAAPREEQGDRLAVALHTRSGSSLVVVRRWAELESSQLDWEVLVRLYAENSLSRGLAYELWRLAREWPEDLPPDFLNAEARRILRRKERRGEEPFLPAFAGPGELEVFAKQLVIARFLGGIGKEERGQDARSGA